MEMTQCDDAEAAMQAVHQYIMKEGIPFVTDVQEKGFLAGGNDLWNILKCKVRLKWSTPHLAYSGTPFVLAGIKILCCHQGRDKNASAKEKKSVMVQQEEHAFCQKRRTSTQPSTKVGCASKIRIWHVVEFPDHKITIDTEHARKVVSKTIRSYLQGDVVSSCLRIQSKWMIQFPAKDSHAGHPTDGLEAEIHQRIHPDVIAKINALYHAGARTVTEIERHLKIYTKQLFHGKDYPKETERLWKPTSKDIRNYLFAAKMKTTFSVDDVEELRHFISLKKNDLWFFQPSAEGNDFCLIVQTVWQKRLLQKYGKTVLLDATYRITRYALSLFFLAVQTNCSYVAVATFVVKSEKTENIKMCLRKLQEWNCLWEPDYFMIDYSLPEIQALESIFPSAKVYLCDFHREKSWQQWLKKQSHGVEAHADRLLDIFRNLAAARNGAMFEEALQDLHRSEVWQSSSQLRSWFTSRWLCIREKWVKMYRNSYMSVNTNNGIERINRSLKDCLSGNKRNSMSDLVKILMGRFFPDMYMRYCRENMLCSSEYGPYASNVPDYLDNRPKILVEHVMEILDTTRLQSNDITEVETRRFKVKSEKNPERVYTVWFGDVSTPPFCECADWCAHKLPCKHMVVIWKFTKWSWNDLYERYRDDPRFALDEDISLPTVDDAQAEQPMPIDASSHMQADVTVSVELDQEEEITAHSINLCEEQAMELVESQSSSRQTLFQPAFGCLSQDHVSLQKSCIKQLKDLLDLAYNANNPAVLLKLSDKLASMKKDFDFSDLGVSQLPRSRTLTPRKRKFTCTQGRIK